MAIDITIPDHRSRLSTAIESSYTNRSDVRERRANLIDIYRDRSDLSELLEDTDDDDLGTLLNLFQKYVRGHLLSVAFFSPKWSTRARTMVGRGFDRRIQDFQTRYSEILNFNRLQKQLALDSAFGWAVCKVTNGIAPKGITAPVAPRMYRINPDMFIPDQSAFSFDETAFLADIYLAPLNEAKEFPGFDEDARENLEEYKGSSGFNELPDDLSANEAFAEPMTRLIDVYIAAKGEIYTWPCPNDNFEAIAADEPLQIRKTPINPYVVLSLLNVPGQLYEISRLASLRGLHLVANEMLVKGVDQARFSQRNPIAQPGNEQDLDSVLQAGDNNAVYTDKTKLGLFNIPGPDSSILSLAGLSASMFSQEAGNLEVALGQSTGADTARQTEALIGQISASQSIDRRTFEEFLAEIGKRLATLAFYSETLYLEMTQRVPGTRYEYSRLWGPPTLLPRVAGIDDFNFEVVPYSTTFRTPQQYLAQLNRASQLIQGWMASKAQGFPINLEAVLRSAEDAFDLVPDLKEWWSGEDPTPAERTDNAYRSFAEPAGGSDVRYHGQQQASQSNSFSGGQEPQAGIVNP